MNKIPSRLEEVSKESERILKEFYGIDTAKFTELQLALIQQMVGIIVLYKSQSFFSKWAGKRKEERGEQ
jgi:hypothetical protein